VCVCVFCLPLYTTQISCTRSWEQTRLSQQFAGPICPNMTTVTEPAVEHCSVKQSGSILFRTKVWTPQQPTRFSLWLGPLPPFKRPGDPHRISVAQSCISSKFSRGSPIVSGLPLVLTVMTSNNQVANSDV